VKLLFISSSLDLRYPLSSTPSWWQLLKNLSEAGVEVLAAPYQGYGIEAPWWRAYDNPCQREGELFRRTRDIARRFRSPAIRTPESRSSAESATDKLVRKLANTVIMPRWQRHVSQILEMDPGVDAVVTLNIPPNQFRGLPAYLARQHGVPTIHYDSDVPASLPQFKGFASGFRHYQGADLSEYAGFISNSKGGVAALERLGARNVHVLYFAVDPEWFVQVPSAQDIDVFFYGHGHEYRGDSIEMMISEPSRRLSQARFAVRSTDMDIDLGRAQRVPYMSFGKLREYSCRSKINLNITRQPHASTYASSTARPFELAAMGCCIVSNHCEGMEEWFQVGKELLVVGDANQATDTYRQLLSRPELRRQMGQAARERVLRDHTYRHRAEQLLGILGDLTGMKNPNRYNARSEC
jgi:hypothetical protein